MVWRHGRVVTTVKVCMFDLLHLEIHEPSLLADISFTSIIPQHASHWEKNDIVRGTWYILFAPTDSWWLEQLLFNGMCTTSLLLCYTGTQIFILNLLLLSIMFNAVLKIIQKYYKIPTNEATNIYRSVWYLPIIMFVPMKSPAVEYSDARIMTADIEPKRKFQIG
jgi:hypothetical protein